MLRCPRCSKPCKNGTRLLQHMNNPASQCILFLDELVKLSEAVGSSQDNDSERQPESCVVQEDSPMNEPHDYSDMVPRPGQENSPSNQWFSDAARASTDDYFVEAYPNASQVYGRGETFMEVFDADVNAENRKDNLYYPFASRQEWQMASFLLRSSLSITAVDEFLSLELVRLFLQSQSLKADMAGHRSDNCISLSVQPRSYVAAQKYFRLVPSGSVRLGQQRIRRRFH